MTIDLRLIADGGLAVEVDPSAQLSATASTLTYTGLNDTAAYEYIDYGASYFANRAYFEGTFNIASITGTTAWYHAFGLSAGIGQLTTTANEVYGLVIPVSSTTWRIRIYHRESSVTFSAQAATILALATNYYYRIGFLSSFGGQYGGSFIQFYSDSGRTALVAAAVLARTANPAYQYLYPISSAATASNSATGTNANITPSTPAAGIDLTTGVETDTGTSRLDVYPDVIVATALNIANSETAKHVSIDKGAGYFTDYKLSGVLNLTSFSTSTSGVDMFDILCVTDGAADALVANDLQGITIQEWSTSASYTARIHQAVGGTDTYSSASQVMAIADGPHTFTLERSGTTVTLKFWSDLVLTNFAGTSQYKTTVTLTGAATTVYRYLMPVASHLNGATSRSSTFTLGGVQIQGGIPTTGYGSSSSILLSRSAITFNKEFSFTSASALFPCSAITHAKVGYSDVANFLRVLSQTEGVNPNVVRTYARLLLASSSSYTREGGDGSAAREGKSSTVVTASKISSGSTAGTVSAKVTITTVGYSGIFLKLISVRFTKANTTTGIQEPVSGLTPTLKVKRGTDGLSFDHNDKLFKTAAAAGANLTVTILETDPTNYPGTYDHFLQVNDFGAGENIVYQLFVQDTTLGYYAEGTIVFRDGVEQWGGVTSAQNTTLNAVAPQIAAIPAAVLSAAQTTPIHADMKQTNGINLKGDGTAADKFRSTLVT